MKTVSRLLTLLRDVKWITFHANQASLQMLTHQSILLRHYGHENPIYCKHQDYFTVF